MNSVSKPIKFSFINENGNFTKFYYGKTKSRKEHTFILNSKSEKIIIPKINRSHVPSFLRDFSAPVSVKTDLTQNDYLKIINFDNDYYNKWEALRKLHSYYFENKLNNEFIKVIKSLVSSNKINNSVLAILLKEPSFEMFMQSKKALKEQQNILVI